MLKLSLAVHSSLSEILICQPCVYDICCCHGPVIITSRSCQKSSLLTLLVTLLTLFFQLFETELHDLIIFASISILVWFCIDFRYFLTFKENGRIQDGGSKIAALMTSPDVIWRHSQQKLCHLVEYATGFLPSSKIFRCAFIGRKLLGRVPSNPTPRSPFFFTMVWVWVCF